MTSCLFIVPLFLAVVVECSSVPHQSLLVADTVEPYVVDMRERFAKIPMVQYLERVAGSNKEYKETNPFLPFMTFFANSFSDVNRVVFPYPQNGEERLDPLRSAINQHTKEDSGHLYMFWKDIDHYNQVMTNAGIDSFADSIRFLWSEALFESRKVGYEVAKLVGKFDKPVHRYAMIRAIEETGSVVFGTGVGYLMFNNTPSMYIGHDHLALENGHLQADTDGGDDQHESKPGDGLASVFNSLEFENVEDREQCLQLMEDSVQIFVDFLLSVYNNMVKAEIQIGEEEEEEGSVYPKTVSLLV